MDFSNIDKIALSNTELLQIGAKIGLNDVLVFLQKDIPKKIKNNTPYIINLDKTQPETGTHWVALFRKGRSYFYFDSYAFLPPESLLPADIQLFYNITQIQDMESQACGLFCLVFLHYMLVFHRGQSGKSLQSAFNKFINIFDKKNLSRNDYLIKSILYKLFEEYERIQSR